MSIDLFNLLCQRRGWDRKTLASYNDPSYPELLDMDVIVEHLHRIHTSRDLIVVLPDFDMDGITAGTLSFAGLAELGFNVGLYRPDHSRGHGFGSYDVERIRDQYPDAKATITCDNGTDSYQGIGHAMNLGMTVLVTDHHKEIPREGVTPVRPHALVNPCRTDETYPNKGICGAHVMYQVLVAYASRHNRDKLDDISLLRLFAGIGTVSDVMPILYENRQLVSDSIAVARLLYVEPETDDEGEKIMPDVSSATLMALLRARPHHPVFISAFEGMARVIAHFAVAGKIRDIDDINEDFYGFYLSPAFNAIRRMDGSMEDGFGAFFASNKDGHIAKVITDNDLRKEMVKELMEQILDSDQPYAPYVYLIDTVRGMLGLIANKLMELNGAPVAVLIDDQTPGKEMSGSCRSPEGFPMNSTLNDAGFHSAGHEQAFGVRIKDSSELPLLATFIRDSYQSYVTKLTSAPGYEPWQPDLRFGWTDDCDNEGDDLDDLVDLARLISTLEPFGEGFRQPVMEVVADIGECRFDAIGADKSHLRITLPSGVRCLVWGAAEDLMPVLEDARDGFTPADRTVRMTGKLVLNHYMGNTTPNFHINQVTPPEAVGAVGAATNS